MSGGSSLPDPWFVDALQVAGARPGSRVLVLTAPEPANARAALDAIGDGGSLVVVEPDRYRAAAVAELDSPALDVVSYRPQGDERFGMHDAIVAAPLFLDDRWPLDCLGSLARGNLRPGGRFVFDFPGERFCDLLAKVWNAVDDARAESPWLGPSDEVLAKLLRGDGLRRIEPSVVTYLLRFESPRDAAGTLGERAGLTDESIDSLQLALAHELQSNDAVDLLFRRTRVSGMR